MKNFEPKDLTPFKEFLKPGVVPAKGAYGLENSPNKIIRKLEMRDWNLVPTGKTEISLADRAKLLRDIIMELQNDYGIKVPAEFVVGHDDISSKNDPCLFIIVDKIQGVILGHPGYLDYSNPKLIQECRDLCLGLISYVFDKYEQSLKGDYNFSNYKDFILIDVFYPNQFMYGRSLGSVEEHIYLIDVEPRANNVLHADFYGIVRDISLFISSIFVNISMTPEDVRIKFNELVDKVITEANYNLKDSLKIK